MAASAGSRRLVVVLAGALLAAAPAAVPVGAHASVAERDMAVSGMSNGYQRTGQYPTRWRCNDSSVCVRLTRRLRGGFAVGWSGVVENRTGRWIRKAQCKSRDVRTSRYETGISLGAELKAGLFATMNATISGSVSREMTTEIEFSVPFDVPPHTDTACIHGIQVFRWRAQRFDRVRQSIETFTVRAPRRVAWRIQDIR